MLLQLDNDQPLRMQIQEMSSYALYKTALQAQTRDEFRSKIGQGIENYEKALSDYNSAGDLSRGIRCRAMISYLSFWLTTVPVERKNLLEQAWTLTKESLKNLEARGDYLEYAKTYDQLEQVLFISTFFESDFGNLKRSLTEALEIGEKAIRLLSTGVDRHQLSRAYAVTASYLSMLYANGDIDIDARDEYLRKFYEYWKKAGEYSETTAVEMHRIRALWVLGWNVAMEGLRRELEYCEKTRDTLLLGFVLSHLSFAVSWNAIGTEDPDKKFELVKEGLQFAEDAKKILAIISFVIPSEAFWAQSPYAEYYLNLALTHESDIGSKTKLLHKALDEIPKVMEEAEHSGYPNAMEYAHHTASKILLAFARTQPKGPYKTELVEKSLRHRQKAIAIKEKRQPYSYWYTGVFSNYLADIRSELSQLTEHFESRKNLLEQAIHDKEAGLNSCFKELAYWERTEGTGANSAALGRWYMEEGEMMIRLAELTGSKDEQRRAVVSYEAAAECFRKPGFPSRIAECYWKIALIHDSLNDNAKSAKSFALASLSYDSAAKKIPQLKEFYADYSLHMKEWNEVENARERHRKQDYGKAREHYEAAAAIARSTKRWGYLSRNYSAWSQVEKAEDLSRRELNAEAALIFGEAAGQFEEGRSALQEQQSKETDYEREMVTNLVNAAGLRRDYCKARIAIEEALILDRQGDHYSSAEKYGEAGRVLEKIAEALGSDGNESEMRLIAILSRAWQKMAQAEAEGSPGLYLEASQLFEYARGLSPNENQKMLIQGHSRFCMALEAGTKFAQTRDPSLHANAVQHLEIASNCYAKAAVSNASEYATASRLLFDAYAYMDEANREKDHEKRSRLYLMAEKVLRASADAYTKSDHSGKAGEVERVLEQVKRQREMATSLSEILKAPTLVGATTAFSMPAPTYEKATGLERFDSANVQANLILRDKSMRVGDNVAVEVELVNAGRGPAQLVKIEELIPEGFELTEKPETYRVEDSFLNMKGRRLDPLKTEEVKLMFKPQVQGSFKFQPRILYLDENGRYRSRETDPIEVTVKELGIKGWIKGR